MKWRRHDDIVGMLYSKFFDGNNFFGNSDKIAKVIFCKLTMHLIVSLFVEQFKIFDAIIGWIMVLMVYYNFWR